MRHDSGAAAAEGLVGSCVVGMPVGVDERANRAGTGVTFDRLQERLTTLLDAGDTAAGRGSSLLAGVRRFTARSKA